MKHEPNAYAQEWGREAAQHPLVEPMKAALGRAQDVCEAEARGLPIAFLRPKIKLLAKALEGMGVRK